MCFFSAGSGTPCTAPTGVTFSGALVCSLTDCCPICSSDNTCTNNVCVTPAITTSITPMFGRTSGGTLVTVFGSGLSSVLNVQFGSNGPCTNLQIAADGLSFTCLTPPGQEGQTVQVTVSTTSKRSISAFSAQTAMDMQNSVRGVEDLHATRDLHLSNSYTDLFGQE